MVPTIQYKGLYRKKVRDGPQPPAAAPQSARGDEPARSGRPHRLLRARLRQRDPRAPGAELHGPGAGAEQLVADPRFGSRPAGRPAPLGCRPGGRAVGRVGLARHQGRRPADAPPRDHRPGAVRRWTGHGCVGPVLHGTGRGDGRRRRRHRPVEGRHPPMTTAVAGGPASRTPPRLLMRLVVNPVVRTVLRSPAGRWCGPLLLLEVTGRRTGRRRRIPVVGHVSSGCVYAVTDASWARNFTGGAPVVVTRRGRR